MTNLSQRYAAVQSCARWTSAGFSYSVSQSLSLLEVQHHSYFYWVLQYNNNFKLVQDWSHVYILLIIFLNAHSLLATTRLFAMYLLCLHCSNQSVSLLSQTRTAGRGLLFLSLSPCPYYCTMKVVRRPCIVFEVEDQRAGLVCPVSHGSSEVDRAQCEWKHCNQPPIHKMLSSIHHKERR